MALAENSISKFPLDQAIKLRFINGLSIRELAEKYKVSPQAITQKLSRFQALVTNPEEVKTYKDNRADLFAAAQQQILDSLTSLSAEEKKALTLRQPGAMALWFNSLFNNERLDRGQSTNITGYSTMSDGDLEQAIRSKLQSAQRIGIRLTEVVADGFGPTNQGDNSTDNPTIEAK